MGSSLVFCSTIFTISSIDFAPFKWSCICDLQYHFRACGPRLLSQLVAAEPDAVLSVRLGPVSRRRIAAETAQTETVQEKQSLQYFFYISAPTRFMETGKMAFSKKMMLYLQAIHILQPKRGLKCSSKHIPELMTSTTS